MLREDLTKFELPDEPGVYQFRKGRKILYVGKATILKDRVRSYFALDIADSRSSAIAAMVAESDNLTWEQTDSVLEALILEANLIKKIEPPYNIQSKDNKSFNYLVITQEKFPKVLAVRGRELFTAWRGGKIKHLYGPFPQGLALRDAMKLVRRIFPYRDEKCTPCEDQKKAGKPHCRPCFNRQVGLCPGVCSGETDSHEYANTIHNICLLFSGKKGKLVKELEKEMQVAAKEERYESAEEARRQVAALTHIRDISLIKSESRFATGGAVHSQSARIEAYDIAHTAGSETVGVMTVIEDSQPLKSAYRKFKIRGFTNNDPGALGEVLSRRFLHPEWPYPRILVVDGHTAQMNAAKKILANAGIMIPVIGVVKNERHQPERLVGDSALLEKHERDILLANSEAHRYAITWHRRRLQKRMAA
jgi:excinuclease ABC subunit C